MPTVWTALEDQAGVVRHHGDEINHVLEVIEERSLGGTGSKPDEELEGEPGGADGLADEEGVDTVTARTRVLGHCLHTELFVYSSSRLHTEHNDRSYSDRHGDHRTSKYPTQL